MKIALFIVLACLLIGIPAQADIIALWDYNDSNTIVDQGAGTQSFEGTAALYSYWGTQGPSDPAPTGKSFTVNNLNTEGSGLSWAVSTAGYNNISICFDIKRNTALSPDDWTWAYDLGSGWVDSTDVHLGSQVFETKTLDLSAIDGTNNNSLFKVKFVNRENLTNNTNVVWDYVKVTGTPITTPAVPEASTLLLAFGGLVGTGAGRIMLRRRK